MDITLSPHLTPKMEQPSIPEEPHQDTTERFYDNYYIMYTKSNQKLNSKYPITQK